MKRTRLVSLLLSCVMLVCTACSSTSSVKDVELAPLMEEILAVAPIDDTLVLGESDMLDFYGIKAEQMKQFSAALNMNGISAQEIVLVQGVDEAAAQEIAIKLSNRLAARMAESENYLPDEFEIISQCEVSQSGTYCRLIIHANAKDAINIYNKAFEK